MIFLLKKSSINVYALLESLLQWAQIQTGNTNYRFEKINIYDSSVKVIELLMPSAQSKKIVLRNKIEENTFCFSR